MTPQTLRIRRATVDDRETLKELWAAMRLPADDLEKRLTEFHVVENSSGEVVGALGIQFSRQHALLHNEGYTDFAVADAARQLFWERVQTLAAHLGVFRVWTQERSPFWKGYGFQPPTAGVLTRLPEEWKNEFDGGWLTLELKNEDAIIAALERKTASLIAAGKIEAVHAAEKARTLKTITTVITVGCFAIGIVGIALAIYLFFHHHPFSQ
mgnify:CR=1 FL=1